MRGGAGLPGSKLEPMLRSQPLDSAIPTIPYAVIAAFLDRPGVISKDEVKQAPYVLALRGEHDIAGEGDELYVKKLDAQTTGARYAVMHVEEPLDDPEGDRKLGYLAIYAGTAQLTRPGQIAKVTLTDSARETLQGDVLVSEDNMTTSDFKPHSPARPVDGQDHRRGGRSGRRRPVRCGRAQSRLQGWPRPRHRADRRGSAGKHGRSVRAHR